MEKWRATIRFARGSHRKRRNPRRCNPVRELHLLRLFPHHHDQDDAQEDAGEDKHPAIRQLVMGHKGQNGNDPGEENSDADSPQDGSFPSLNR